MINGLLHRLATPRCRCQIREWVRTILILLVSENLLSWLVQFLITVETPHRALYLDRCIRKWQLAPRRLLATIAVLFLETRLPLVL